METLSKLRVFFWNVFPSMKSKDFPREKSNEAGSVILTPSSITEMLTRLWNTESNIRPFCRKGGQKRWSLACLFGYFLKWCLHREQCWQSPLKQSNPIYPFICGGALNTKLLLMVTAIFLSSWVVVCLVFLLIYFSVVFLLLRIIDWFLQSELHCFLQHCLQLLILPDFFSAGLYTNSLTSL